MVRINVFLLKKNFTKIFPYSMVNSKVVAIKNSIFASDVYLSGQEQIRSYILSQNRSPKEVLRANSDHEIYYRNNPSYEPSWKSFWGISDDIKQRTSDAVAIIRVNTRTLAICHGHSYHLLNPYAIETFFGIRAAINMLDPQKINSADILSPSEISFQVRKRTGIGAEFEDFEINTLNTLLRNITGKVKPEYKQLLKSVDGADSFRFSFNGTPSSLVNVLSELLTIYELDNYKKTVFKYLDNFRPVRDQVVIDSLDNKLLEAINKKHHDVFITTPVDLNYTGVFNFKFKGFGVRSNNIFDNFDIRNTMYNLLNRSQILINEINELKKYRLVIVDHNNPTYEIHSFSLYRCLYYEIHGNDKWCFIDSGVWYEVDNAFSSRIDVSVKKTACLKNKNRILILQFFRIKILRHEIFIIFYLGSRKFTKQIF